MREVPKERPRFLAGMTGQAGSGVIKHDTENKRKRGLIYIYYFPIGSGTSYQMLLNTKLIYIFNLAHVIVSHL